MRIMIVVIAFFLCASGTAAQEATSVTRRTGGTPDAPARLSTLTLHGSLQGGILPSTIALTGLPGIASCCPEYTSASGWIAGLSLGVGYHVSRTVALEGGLGIAFTQPTTEAQEVIPMNAQFQTVDGTIEHRVSISIVQVMVAMGISAELAPGFRLMAAPSILLPMSATFTQTEELVEPSTVEFIDGTTTWNNADGPLSVDPVFSIGGGARYTFEIGASLSIGPEVWYHVAVTDLVSDWRMHRLTIGVVVISGL